jgi:hypothetical protein
MQFGLFGSALAKRGGPDVDSGQGFKTTRGKGGRGAWLHEHVRGRAPFHWPGQVPRASIC